MLRTADATKPTPTGLPRQFSAMPNATSARSNSLMIPVDIRWMRHRTSFERAAALLVG
jgi:hypothetical protein